MLGAAPERQTRTIMLTTDAVGGVWRYTLELAAQWAAQGIRVLLVAMGPRPDDRQLREAATIPNLQLITTDLPLDWLAPTPAALRQAAHDLAALAARHHADTIHLHTPALVADAVWACPVVAMAHSCVGTWWRAVHGGVLPPDLSWRADSVAQGLAAADAVIAPSHSFADTLAQEYSCDRRIDVVWNGRRPAAVSSDSRGSVFTAGRLWDLGKNVAVIDAAAGLLDVPVVAAGSLQGPHGGSIAYRYLRCLGPLDDAAMAAQYGATGIFVSMARYEPFGLAVLEAAQAGCALILSDIATFRELWNGAALFVDPSDAHALATTIRDCLRTPGQRDRLAMLARQRAARFSAEAMAAQTWQIHQPLLAPSASQAAS
jgi:glycosyltransferase involved in cell wall biosynthesis